MNANNIRNMLKSTAVYVQDGLQLRMQHVDDEHDCFVALDEDTGEEYTVQFSDINFGTDQFLQLVLINPAEYDE